MEGEREEGRGSVEKRECEGRKLRGKGEEKRVKGGMKVTRRGSGGKGRGRVTGKWKKGR